MSIKTPNPKVAVVWRLLPGAASCWSAKDFGGSVSRGGGCLEFLNAADLDLVVQFFLFSAELHKIPTDFHIFQRGWNHQADVCWYNSGTLGPLSCKAVYVESRYLFLFNMFFAPLFVFVLPLDRRGMKGRMTIASQMQTTTSFFFKGDQFRQSAASKPTFTTWDSGTHKSK